MLGYLWDYVITNWIEVSAFILSVAGVWLAAKEKIVNWPVNILASAIYTFIFYKSLLYGDASLNLFFVFICFYGWYEWMYGGNQHEHLKISASTKKILFVLFVITILGCFVFGKLESMYTKSDVPYWDGITTALSLAATWMSARKLIENWLVWIFTDLLYVGMYIIKHLYLTSLLYFIFTLLAIYGYYAWKKQLTQASNA